MQGGCCTGDMKHSFAVGSDIGLSAKVDPSHVTDLTFAVIKSIVI